MSGWASPLLWLHEPRLRALALSRMPAWLWSRDTAHVRWANPIGAAIFGALSPSALQQRTFDGGQPAAAQIATIAASLPPDGTARLERLLGYGAGIGRKLTCSCSLFTLADGSTGILVAAIDRAGPDLPLKERVARLIADCSEPLAVYSADGTLIDATPAAHGKVGGRASLASLEADALLEAAHDGLSAGNSGPGPVVVDVIGEGTDAVLVVSLGAPAERPSPAPVPFPVSAAPARLMAAPAPTLAAPAPALLVPATTLAAPAPTLAAPAPALDPPKEYRHPLRFVWRMDAQDRLAVDTPEFITLTGAQTADILGQPWAQIAESLGLDPDGQVGRAIATRNTWSGLSVSWSVDGSRERLAVELSGLPVFDRDRTFLGYRGFGVCRDIPRLNVLARAREASAATEGAENVVPFPVPAEAAVPALSPGERHAFHELSRRLAGHIHAAAPPPAADFAAADAAAESHIVDADLFAPEPDAFADDDDDGMIAQDVRPFLDRMPFGVLVYRLSHLLYANDTFLQWAGYETLDALAEAGGLDTLMVGPGAVAIEEGGRKPFAIASPRDEAVTAEARLLMVPWAGESAFALLTIPNTPAAEDSATSAATEAEDVTEPADVAATTEAQDATEPADVAAPATTATESAELPVPAETSEPTVPAEAAGPTEPAETAEPAPTVDTATLIAMGAERDSARAEAAELHAILDTATDGVVVLDRAACIVSVNRSAQALFGADAAALLGRPFSNLFATDSVDTAIEYLERLQTAGLASLLNDGREIVGREQKGGAIPLFMTMGRLGESGEKFCAVFRDITPWKRTEEDLIESRRQAEKASSARSDFLARISHEIRTPLNAIIGFSEVMMEERFGPVGNDRYRQYMKDIHASGRHLISLINDLLDLSKIEAGKLELAFSVVSINDLAQECVAIMQPQANSERIVIRTSLSPKLPEITADPRSVRQIVLNLLSNAIKFTEAGGQVIVSTTAIDLDGVVLRVRDNGIGMNERDIATALEPFRQIATATRARSGGTGLGLPLTKALAEANRASFVIRSTPRTGTLVEVKFPPAKVMAEP